MNQEQSGAWTNTRSPIYSANDPDPNEPPFKYRSIYLADVLAEGWRIHASGGRVVSIMQEERSVFDNESLLGALTHISELSSAEPERPLKETAEQVLREMGKADAAA